MFEWDRNNLRKIRAHRIQRKEAETHKGRLLALVVTERGDLLRVVTAYDLDAGQRREYLSRRMQGSDRMTRKVGETKSRAMKATTMPKFATESDEADWWASPAGRAFVKKKSAEAQAKGTKVPGSALLSQMRSKSSVQIALRLPQADLDRARKIAEKKGLGYQTLLKMLVHEGLTREARRG